MQLPPFLLDRWIEQKQDPESKIEFDLASSTGPVWTLRELLALAGGGELDGLLDTPVSYTAAPGTPALRNAIAGLEGVDPDSVQVVTGASEALLILFYLAAGPDANVVLPDPGFPANAALAESLHIAVRYYRLRAANEFRVDPDEIRRLVDRNTRMVLVNSPHNPTGAVMGEEEVEALHDFCAERGVQLVCDQVYHPIYHGAEQPTAARLPHATVISDFSKALCLSGLRIGWMVDHDAARRERYLNARNYFTITANVFGERLAALALRHRESIYGRAREVSARNLKLLDEVFARHTDSLRWVRPRGGMTAFPSLASAADTREFCRRLAGRGVLMVPGDCFGQPGHFRLGFAASGERFAAAIARFEEFLSPASVSAS
ncbi:MAG TPA: aminotransferase class I/II-fold pyridoxal phosphate-dependent enzyme [Bryobacteraceae bacterium]|nr:aminotransferase class I/II-fold pyridoxal phosphate-dependent enzyme [Bryobacteraceae bacterium]